MDNDDTILTSCVPSFTYQAGNIYIDNNTTITQVQSRDILKELDEMRDALLLLKRHVDMEAKYPRLRELKDQYEAALEQYKTFERLKK
jgi:hypothetical protein